mmetsp:Transcript_14561/g.47545  ORF Transcript_14561/g.47545 Transcript_14561/m.47545 type:complete len:220 (+) Transcript_14561:252-911(+)
MYNNPAPTQISRVSESFSSAAASRSMSTDMSAWAMSSWQEPEKTRPRDRAAIATTSSGVSRSDTTGISNSSTSSLAVPMYASPSPSIAPILSCGLVLPGSTYSVSSASAGSHSLRTPELRMPTASSAPALMLISVMYRNLSIWVSPPSTSQASSAPSEAAADIMPCSLFLYSHLLPSVSMSLSAPKPRFTKALTKVEARLARAESTAAAEAGRFSRWVL